jgi:hypothetical protein
MHTGIAPKELNALAEKYARKYTTDSGYAPTTHVIDALMVHGLSRVRCWQLLYNLEIDGRLDMARGDGMPNARERSLAPPGPWDSRLTRIRLMA